MFNLFGNFFHPFGGAVDIITVQQQDKSFRCTPWYVQFGKFQGVLKSAEKIVRIEVNGLEADFHMYLDNSGEAYFIREVKDTKGVRDDISTNTDDNIQLHKNDTSVSNTGEVYLQDENVSLGVNRLERMESNTERRFYDFEDKQSSLDESEYGSSHYETLDTGEHMMESGNVNSEVILVSVDGRRLTAPILLSEGNSGEDMRLRTLQYHLGPGEETLFCKGNAGFSTGEPTWPSEHKSNLSTSTAKVEGDGKDFSKVQETQKPNQENDELAESAKGANGMLSRAKTDVFKSCLDLELQELVSVEGLYQQEVDLPTESRAKSADTQDNSPHSVLAACETEDASMSLSENGGALSPLKTELSETNATSQIVHSSSHQEPEDENSVNGLQSSSLAPNLSTRFEISLCGNLLYVGMGLRAAAEVFNGHRVSEEDFKLNASSIIKHENLVVKFQERYFLWEKAAPMVLGMAVYGLDLPIDPNDSIGVEPDETLKLPEEDSGATSSPSGRRWRLWSIPFMRVKTSNSSEDVFVDFEASPRDQGNEIKSPHKQLLRTNVPTSEQIASLKLNEGQNLVTFSFCTRVLGMQTVEAHIYLWKWNTRIVISDVDGTITKSDVLGQFMPLVGKDWSQSGVARLFSAIKENGYQLLFLSARAIVQSYLTKSFLVNLKQDGKALPHGPVVISPDGLFPSLYREVIRRAPHEFKIACLEDIKALFPADHNPFYAGFGNRDTDELSYRKIGIPKGKFFIINPKGEVAISDCIDSKSYTSLHTLVDDMFPPISMLEQVQEDFNQWRYWRMPIPDIDNL